MIIKAHDRKLVIVHSQTKSGHDVSNEYVLDAMLYVLPPGHKGLVETLNRGDVIIMQGAIKKVKGSLNESQYHEYLAIQLSVTSNAIQKVADADNTPKASPEPPRKKPPATPTL